jgi:hypothetical protein
VALVFTLMPGGEPPSSGFLMLAAARDPLVRQIAAASLQHMHD